uniref:Uncharacterized protein isoform X1 n=1 Tax=Nicotiana tabacum TaxID=4097 RepID=A0A1S3X8J7_TOBAC|nr:PREDICTED: uncharacterized protein LOC107762373 isoform X1 [Nicotiana tabacum]
MLLNSSSLNSYRKSSLPYRVFFFSSSSSPCPRTFIAGRWGKEEETGEWGKHHKQEDWQADLEGDQIVCPSFLAHLEGLHADPGASEAECELFSRSAIAGDFEVAAWRSQS